MALKCCSRIPSSEAMSGDQTGARGRGKTGLVLSSPRAGQTEEWPPASWTLVNVPHAPQRNFWQEKGKYTRTLEPTTVEGETVRFLLPTTPHVTGK